MRVLSDRMIVFCTSPRVPRVVCEEKYFFIMGGLGTSPTRGPPLPLPIEKTREDWERVWLFEKTKIFK